MKVLLSCDENPFYYDFWPYARDVWRKRLNIDPCLILISDTKQTNSFENDILYVKKIPDYPTHLQAQLARIYFTQKFSNEICMVSDIDMFPVSRSFFNKERIESYCTEDSFFHLNPERREFGQFPLCYYCGYGSLYEKLFLGLSWPEFLELIIKKDFNTDKFQFRLPPHLQDKKLWFSDEVFMFTRIQELNLKILLNNELIGGRRLDREGIINFDFFKLLWSDNVIDIHLPRPLNDFKPYIEKIYDTLTL